MAREMYSIKEAWNRILRSFKGQSLNELPDTLTPEVLSENEAMSEFAELLNDSLPGETLSLPTAMRSAITSAGFASGTASSLTIVTGTASILVGATRFVFTSGLNVQVTGTTAYISRV